VASWKFRHTCNAIDDNVIFDNDALVLWWLPVENYTVGLDTSENNVWSDGKFDAE